MINIVLVQAPFWSRTTTSLALGYLHAHIANENRNVVQINFNLKDFENYDNLWKYMNFLHKPQNDLNFLYPEKYGFIEDDRTFQILNLSKQWADDILKHKPDVVGFSLHDTTRLFSLLVARELKKHDCLIVFGGEECEQDESGKFLASTGIVDVLVTGEGEQTFEEIIQHVEQKKPLEQIDGCIIIKDGEPTEFKPRRMDLSFRDYKYPIFNQEDIDNSSNPFMVPMTATRGCVAKCRFCTEVVYWKFFRFRKADDIIKEMLHHQKTYGAKAIRFNDSLINGNMKLLMELCDELIKQNVNMTWMGNARFEGLTYETLQKMYDAGCRYLMFGMESASQDVLELMNKKTKVDVNQEILDNCKKIGIWTHTYVLVGFPNEEPKDFLETVKFMARNQDRIQDYSIGSLYITDYSYIFKNQKDFNIEFEERKQPLVKYVYTKSNNKNFNQGIYRMEIIEKLFHNYLTIKNYNEKFVENKPFSGPRDSLLIRPFLLDETFYTPSGYGNVQHVVLKPTDSIPHQNNIFITFSIEEKDFQTNTGDLILKQLQELKDNDIQYRITKPLPRCIFGDKYKLAIENFQIPKDCTGCISFLSADNDELSFCKNCEISNKNQTASFNTCNTCEHKINKTCNGFCLSKI